MVSDKLVMPDRHSVSPRQPRRGHLLTLVKNRSVDVGHTHQAGCTPNGPRSASARLESNQNKG